MKTEKQIRKGLLKYLKGLKKNCKKYRVFGDYIDDKDNRHDVYQEFDTKQECIELWCEIETDIREDRYDRLICDPEILGYCKEDYDDWDDMDEDLQMQALREFVIENYCTYQEIGEQINLAWFNQKEFLKMFIDQIKNWYQSSVKFYPFDHKIDDNLITFKLDGLPKTALMLEEPSWNILERMVFNHKDRALAFDLQICPDYRVKCLIDGQIDWVCLCDITIDCDYHIDECGTLDHESP